MVLKISSFLIFLFLSFTAVNVEPIKTFSTKAKSFELDDLGNLYFVDNFKIKKLDSKRGIEMTYDQMNLGEVSSFDVSNPMKLLIYFQDLQTIQWLDNNLSAHADPIDLSFKYDGNIDLVCYSKNNHIWMYQVSTQTIIRADFELNEVTQSFPMNSFVKGDIRPTLIREYNDYIYLMDPKHGALVFDIFGTFVKKIDILKDGSSFHWYKNQVTYLKENQLYRCDLQSLIEKKLAMDLEKVQQVRYANKKLYVKRSNQLEIWQLEKDF